MTTFLFTQNLTGLGFDLSRSLNVKSNGAVEFSMNDFLLMLAEKIWSNSPLARYKIRLQNLGDLEIIFVTCTCVLGLTQTHQWIDAVSSFVLKSGSPVSYITVMYATV